MTDSHLSIHHPEWLAELETASEFTFTNGITVGWLTTLLADMAAVLDEVQPFMPYRKPEQPQIGWPWIEPILNRRKEVLARFEKGPEQ